MAPITGRMVDGETARLLREGYGALVKAGRDSVRAAWRFGQMIDSTSDRYTRADLADALDLSVGTLGRYLRLYHAYQRPELAEQAAAELETYNIDVIVELHDQLHPVKHARPYAGRRYRYRCHSCKSTDIQREEITDPDELAELDRAAELVEAAQ